nr:MAG TPA: hypothetical protein [Caudoviricetes sp.]
MLNIASIKRLPPFLRASQAILRACLFLKRVIIHLNALELPCL